MCVKLLPMRVVAPRLTLNLSEYCFPTGMENVTPARELDWRSSFSTPFTVSLPALVVGRVQCNPQLWPEGVAHVRLNARERILLAQLSTEKIFVVIEPPGAGIGFKQPFAHRMRQAKLGLGRPAVGAKVHQFGLVVFTGGPLRPRLKPRVVLGSRCMNSRGVIAGPPIRFTAAQLGVADALPRHRRGLHRCSVASSCRVGNRHRDVRRSARDAEGASVSQRECVDFASMSVTGSKDR